MRRFEIGPVEVGSAVVETGAPLFVEARLEVGARLLRLPADARLLLRAPDERLAATPELSGPYSARTALRWRPV